VIDVATIKARAAARLAAGSPPTLEMANPAKWLTPTDTISQLATLASNDPTASGPDAYCWPHSSALNTAELSRMAERLRLFAQRSVSGEAAERLADRLVIRDRQRESAHVCIECSLLSGSVRRGWRCGNHRGASICRDLADDFVTTFQRCPAFDARVELR